jgi:predicted RND superfamily exporter protein
MWENIGRFVLKFRIPLLIVLLLATAFMGYHASKVQLSYEFAKAIPTDNPKYKAYQDFKKQFGEDGNLLVIGFQTDQLFKEGFFRDFREFNTQLKKVDHVEDLLSIAGAIQLIKNDSTEKLMALPVFPARDLSQTELDT